ncbi:MAG: glycosyltransferase [Pseudomonadales bacterium]
MAANPDDSASQNLAVYIVFGVARTVVNDRIKKLLRLRRLFDKMVLVTPGKQNSDDSEGVEVKPLPNPTGIFQRLGLTRLRKTLDQYLFFPSPHILFVLTARRKLLKFIADDLAQGKHVCLLTGAPPHGVGLIGLYIKHKFPQVHWIIDWQDLWSYDENYYYITPKLYRNRLKKCEQRMLQTADMNVTTNAHAKAVLEEHYGVPPSRTSFIHHHFDREDVAGEHNDTPTQTIARHGDAIKLGFLGTLFKPPRVPGGDLVAALAQLRASGRNVELHVHGLLPRDYEQSKEHLREAGIIMHGPSSHEEAVKQLAQYDFLLLLLADLPNCKVVMSIKLPHYLMMGKPILAIVPERSAIADIITDTGAGVVIPTHSDWSAELRKILGKGLQDDGIPQRNEAMVNQFEWEKVSTQWCDLLAAAAHVSKKRKEHNPNSTHS